MNFHPLSNIFPLMEGREFEELKSDIKEHGLREAVVAHDGMILDGRNRYRACHELGIEPETKDFTGNDPAAFVVSLNLYRRHLNESQRAMVAAKLATLPKGTNQHAQICAPTQERAAELLNVSRRTVQSAREVLRNGTPELVLAVEQGRAAVSTVALELRSPVGDDHDESQRHEAHHRIKIRKLDQRRIVRQTVATAVATAATFESVFAGDLQGLFEADELDEMESSLTVSIRQLNKLLFKLRKATTVEAVTA